MCRTYSCRGETASSLRHCHRRVGERAPERPRGDVDRQRGKRSSRAAEHRKTRFKAYPLYRQREEHSPRAIERRSALIPPSRSPACRRTRGRAPARRRRSAAWETFFPRRRASENAFQSIPAISAARETFSASHRASQRSYSSVTVTGVSENARQSARAAT